MNEPASMDAAPTRQTWGQMARAALAAPLRPPIETARQYNLTKLRKDLIAGLTVSVVELPQAMAYAMLAGVPPEYGIYASVVQGVIGALLSSSEHMTTGPTNTQSLLIASAVTRLANPTADPETYLRLVFALTLIKGIIQLAFAAARMGDMVRYVSRSVIVGLAAGAGVLIIAGQTSRLVGLDLTQIPHRFAGVAGEVEKLLGSAREINTKSLIIGGITLVIVLGIRAVSKLLPGALFGVVVGAVIVATMGWTSSDLALVGELPRQFPRLGVPSVTWAEVQGLFGGALALAILGMLESVAIAKSIAAHTGTRIAANQEFFAQGFTNSLSSLFQCIPGSGSFTRSALDHAAGAETRFAAVYNALFVGVLFWLAGGLAKFIPLASLAAVLIVIGWGLIDFRYVPRMLRVSRADAIVCAMTFAAAMIVPLEYAIFFGVFLNLALYLRIASRLHATEIHESSDAQGAISFIERPIRDKQTGAKEVVFLQLEGDLFFALADELEDRLTALERSGIRVVILRLKRTHSIDGTVLGVIERFVEALRERDGQLILCGVRPEIMNVLNQYGLIDQLGAENVFPVAGAIFTSAKMALQRARVLLGHSIDTSDVASEAAQEPDYVI